MEAPYCKLCETNHWNREPHVFKSTPKAKIAIAGRMGGKTAASNRAMAAKVAEAAKDVTPKGKKAIPRKKTK